MRRLQGVILGLLLAFATLPALAQEGDGGGDDHHGAPAPLAGVGLPALAAGALGYLVYRIKNRSK
jgi:hypothetical protein